MRFNPFRTTAKTPVLLAITPPRNAERTVLGVENLLGSIAVPEPFSLELTGDADGVALMARCADEEVVRQQLSAHYPQARIHQLTPEEDPLRLDGSEQAWSITLRSSGPEYVPLRVFRDDDLLDAGSDPLIALLGALSALRPGERVVARLLLRSLGPDWSRGHQERAHRPAVPERHDSYQISESRRHPRRAHGGRPRSPWALAPSSRATSGGRRASSGRRSRSARASPLRSAWPAGPGRAGSAPATASMTRC